MKSRWLIAAIPLMFLWIPCAHSWSLFGKASPAVAVPEQSFAARAIATEKLQADAAAVKMEDILGATECSEAVNNYRTAVDAATSVEQVCSEMDAARGRQESEEWILTYFSYMLRDSDINLDSNLSAKELAANYWKEKCHDFISRYATAAAKAREAARAEYWEKWAKCTLGGTSLASLKNEKEIARGVVCRVCGKWPEELGGSVDCTNMQMN